MRVVSLVIHSFHSELESRHRKRSRKESVSRDWKEWNRQTGWRIQLCPPSVTRWSRVHVQYNRQQGTITVHAAV
jgi:hypothetical protein